MLVLLIPIVLKIFIGLTDHFRFAQYFIPNLLYDTKSYRLYRFNTPHSALVVSRGNKSEEIQESQNNSNKNGGK